MFTNFDVTFVAAVNSREVLEQNLLASPCLRSTSRHEILIQEHYASASAAYNDALRKAANNLIVFVHQDVFLPDAWLSQLGENLRRLEEKDPDWGVVGCWGARADGELCGRRRRKREEVYRNRFPRARKAASRCTDPQRILEELEAQQRIMVRS